MIIKLNGLENNIQAHSFMDLDFFYHAVNSGFNVLEIKEIAIKKLLKISNKRVQCK